MKRKSKATEPQREIAINLYRSVWEVRNDGWIHLSDNANRLASAEAGGGDVDLARERVTETLDLLEPIESYWAFPGRHGFQRLLSPFQEREYDGFNDLVHRISRALSSQSYRKSFVSLHLDEEAAVEEEERRETEVRVDRPYFEVLIVDHPSAQEEETLRHRLRSMRRDEDRFIYELVVVPSFQDCADRRAVQFQPAGLRDPIWFPAAVALEARHSGSTAGRLRGGDWKACPKANAAACSAPGSRSCGPSS